MFKDHINTNIKDAIAMDLDKLELIARKVVRHLGHNWTVYVMGDGTRGNAIRVVLDDPDGPTIIMTTYDDNGDVLLKTSVYISGNWRYGKDLKTYRDDLTFHDAQATDAFADMVTYGLITGSLARYYQRKKDLYDFERTNFDAVYDIALAINQLMDEAPHKPSKRDT